MSDEWFDPRTTDEVVEKMKAMQRKAVIVDVDGTLCNVSPVIHHLTAPGQKKDFTAFHAGAMECPPNEWVIEWCQQHVAAGRELVIVTGRKYEWEEKTRAWLDRYLPDYHGPFMRGDDDNRDDTEVKRDIYEQLINDHGFDIIAAIDDRPRVIKLWESLDIPTTVVKSHHWTTSGEYYD